MSDGYNNEQGVIPVRAKVIEVELMDCRADGIKAFSIDHPKAQDCVEGHEVLIAGWVLADIEGCALDVEISHRGILLRSCKVNIPRADVAVAYSLPESSGRKLGFHCKLSMMGLDRLFSLDVQIRIQRELGEPRKIKLCRIKAEKTQRSVLPLGFNQSE